MSSSKTSDSSNLGFWIVASLVLILNVGLATAIWPLVVQAAHSESDQLTSAGRQAQGSEAQLDFELAHRLNPANQQASLALAQLQIAAGQSQAAVRTLQRAGQGIEVLRLQLKTQLELEQTGAAVTTAQALVHRSAAPGDQTLAAYTYLLANQLDQFNTLMPLVSAPEARQRILAAQASPTALGQQLYALELLKSSQTLLMKQPNSVPRDLVLAAIAASHQTADFWREARDFYTAALTLDPANQAARQGLITSLQALGDNDAAAKQAALLAQLQAGRP